MHDDSEKVRKHLSRSLKRYITYLTGVRND
ncbi:hypothetical protein CL89_gp021 [Aeromonas phage PX29]|uniref:Uncharacterized protein n=1 Tax=Aeromonas phage PX29 TaxID=926067 RepID=E5DPV4_9CAUD|nr:hypothetical protein CL89_gp021 [Aeromonas phage PX29]ADQ52740.1 hypothetical protein PX29p021 [Aeromonas phage PX29]